MERNALLKYLKKVIYNLIECKCGKNGYNLIIMDVNMAILDGIEATK